jgi:hypothetical protein
MRVKVIACEVVARELYWCAARARHTIDIMLLPQGLHNNSDICRTRLQEQIEASAADRYDAVLMGYGLCNNSLVGVRAGPVPLIVPRAHDCITLLLGSKERYAALFAEHPGTYWYSSGWIECRQKRADPIEVRQNSGLEPLYKAGGFDELVAKYGEENAKYLAEFMSHWEDHYTRGALISFEFDKHLNLEQEVRRICAEKGWTYFEVPGDLALLQAGLDGEWDGERFLRIEPGRSIRASYDAGVMAVTPCAGEARLSQEKGP